MAHQPETRFKLRVQKDLSSLPNTWFCKIQQTCIVGTPDILMCINGYFVALELKTDKGKTSKVQDYNLKKITNCGGISFVAMPDNWDEIFEIIKCLLEE